MNATTQNLRDQTDDFADRAAHRISEAASTASSAIKGASGRVSSAVGDVSDRASAASHDLSRRVEQQPLAAVLIAAGAGLMVGLLLGRR